MNVSLCAISPDRIFTLITKLVVLVLRTHANTHQYSRGMVQRFRWKSGDLPVCLDVNKPSIRPSEH